MGDTAFLAVAVTILLGTAVVAFPIYVLVRLWRLGAAVQELRRQVAELSKPEPAGEAKPSAVAVAVEPEAIPGTRPPTEPARAPTPPLSAEAMAAQPLVALPSMPQASAQPKPPGVVERVRESRGEVGGPGPGAPPPPPPRETAVAGPGPDLESVLGVNWLAKLGVVALAIAAAYFLKYAFDSGWIGPTAQVAIGLVAAGALLSLGQVLLTRHRYRAYAQVLSSGGIIIYFLSVYAAFGFYHLIEFPVAFAMLAVGALAASALAMANDTQAVALLCLAGAFLTPVLLHRGDSGAGDMVRFYAYLAGLNIWSAALVRAKRWPSVTALSFFATWVLFFGSDPGGLADYKTTEAFAAIYLVFACYGGAAGMQTLRDRPAASDQDALTEPQMGVGLIVLGCAVFAIASVLILAGAEAFGLPALASIGVLLALLLAGIAFALQQSAEPNATALAMVRYLAAVTLVLLVALTIPSATVVARERAPVTFGFALFSYLLFLAVAWQMRRQAQGDGPATLLFGANAITHTIVSFHALGQVTVWGIPAAAVWLPLAGWLALLGYLLSGRPRQQNEIFPPVAMVVAQAMPLIAFFGSLTMARATWPAGKATALFLAEFLLVSATWVGVRRVTRLANFRGDLMGALGNAVTFFGMLAAAARLEVYQGFVLLCGLAIALAGYHAAVGASALGRRDDDLLLRYTYLGLALTFVTIAIPIQLRASYLTLAWAVESVVLLWTGMAVREPRLRWYGVTLLAVTALKAFCYDLPETPSPFRFLINPRMLSGASVIAASYLAFWVLRKGREALSAEETCLPPILAVLANLLTLLFVSLDLWNQVGNTVPMMGRSYAQQLTLSIFWSVYALAAMSVGIWRRSKPVRLFALALLYLSIAKVFLFDLSFLQQLYRIISLFGLGVILLLVSLIYLRFEERLR